MLGNCPIGGDSPISVQSMCNTDTRNINKTLCQINELYEAGCQIVRLAVLDSDAAKVIKDITKESPIPVVADIHFDWRLAMMSLENNIHGLRLNPGNIKNEGRIREIVKVAKERKVPIRIGVNAGSLEVEKKEKYKDNLPQGMLESALEQIRILEDEDFDLIKISLKASDVLTTIKAYELISNVCEYPLHLGITEAGLLESSSVKSSIGIGYLLLNGIGDTIRVSITGNPVQEISIGREILSSVGLLNEGFNFISCPTCGRTQAKNFESEVRKVKTELLKLKKPKKRFDVAIMGCVVNGPGEASSADIGICFGGKDKDKSEVLGAIIKKGKVIKTLPQSLLIDELINEVKSML